MSRSEILAPVVDGIDVVFHQAALGSVQRSVERPVDSDSANTHGTLAVLKAALDARVRRVIYASPPAASTAERPS